MSTGGPGQGDRETSVDDALDELYGVAPDDFLARRKDLVAAAKRRGDTNGAKLIGGSRRPTTAAWVVNALVRADPTATGRIDALRDRLRAAHAAMDGAQIRELTATQRKLVDELARTGFAAAGVAPPSAALRDDVVGTLQAAVADPDVAARLGRLEKAERWSGFGDFGTVTAVGPATKAKAKASAASKAPSKRSPAKAGPDEREVAAARDRLAAADRAARAAEQAKAEADEMLADRAAALATARRHYEKLLESVDAAERALNAADEGVDAATRDATAAADRLAAATAELESADAECQRLAASTDSSS